MFKPADNTPVAVVKFGGSSVDHPEDVLRTVEHNGDSGIVIVVSALSGVTNKLLAIANGDPAKKEQTWNEIVAVHERLVRDNIPDAELVFGIISSMQEFFATERMRTEQQNEAIGTGDQRYVEDNWIYLGEVFSAYILEKIFNALQRKRIFQVTNLQGSVALDVSYPKPEGMYEDLRRGIRERVRDAVVSDRVAIIPGHPGTLPNGGILALTDRGYSDWTAVQTAIALRDWKSVHLIIAKEIDHLYSADPKTCKEARARAEITVKELQELADGAGIKAINPSAAAALVRAIALQGNGERRDNTYQIALTVKNTMKVEALGTRMVSKLSQPEKQQGVRFISGKKNQALIRVTQAEMSIQSGWVSRITEVMAKYNVSIGPISGANTSIVFTIDADHPKLTHVILELREIAQSGSVDVEDSVALIYCVGDNLTGDRQCHNRIGSALLGAGIDARPLSTDMKHNYILVVDPKDFDRAIEAINTVAVCD